MCDNLTILALAPDCEETHSWKEVLPNFPKEMLLGINAALARSISSASEGKYLIVVISGPRLLSVLIFNGQEWRRRDAPDCAALIHGMIDTIIHDGTIFLTTYMGFHKISFEAILATSNPQWEKLSEIPKENRSNLTTFDHVVVLTPGEFGNEYVPILLDA